MNSQSSIKEMFDKTKQTRPLILDGAIGCYLQERNPTIWDKDIWIAKMNSEKPEEVKDLARMYLEAGAEIITTNTFPTTPFRIHRFNRNNPDAKKSPEGEVEKCLKLYTDLRKETGKNFIIAGSNACVERCYHRDRKETDEDIKDSHETHIGYLMKHGADIIINEALQHSCEAYFSADYCKRNNINFITSLYFDDDLKMMSGEPVLEVLQKLDEYGPLAVAVNCISYSRFKKLMEAGADIIKNLKCGFGYYLNCGDPDKYETNYLANIWDVSITPQDYLKIYDEFNHVKPVFVGHCCVSGPEHTKELSKYIKQ